MILQVPPSPPARAWDVRVIRVEIGLELQLFITLFLDTFIFKGVALLCYDGFDILSEHGISVGDSVSEPDLIIVIFKSKSET